MQLLSRYGPALKYVFLFLAGASAAFGLILALANGSSWVYIWQISGFSLGNKLTFIGESALNALRFSGHILPISWLTLSLISGYVLAEYRYGRSSQSKKTYTHYSWLAPLMLVIGMFLVGFSASSIFAQANRLVFTETPEANMAMLVALLGVTQGVLAAVYTYRWARHAKIVTD